MAQSQPKEHRVDIVLNYFSATFELRYLSPEKKVEIDTRVSLLNYTRSLNQLPVLQYRIVTYLMLTFLTFGTILCLCILKTQCLGLIIVACLLILLFLITIPISLYQYKAFAEKASKITYEFASEREEIKINMETNFCTFWRLLFKPPKTIFCEIRILPITEEQQAVPAFHPPTVSPPIRYEYEEEVDVIYEYQPKLNYALATNRFPIVKSSKYKYPSDPLISVFGRPSCQANNLKMNLANLGQIETGTDEAFLEMEKRTKSERHNDSPQQPDPVNNDVELPPGSGHFDSSVSINMSVDSE